MMMNVECPIPQIRYVLIKLSYLSDKEAGKDNLDIYRPRKIFSASMKNGIPISHHVDLEDGEAHHVTL
jgi:hypothetical protein